LGTHREKYGKLEEIFCKYNHKKLEKTNPHELVYKVKSIQCGNRAINKQMESLNITLEFSKKLKHNTTV
jgi:hypothetical protein